MMGGAIQTASARKLMNRHIAVATFQMSEMQAIGTRIAEGLGEVPTVCVLNWVGSWEVERISADMARCQDALRICAAVAQHSVHFKFDIARRRTH